MKKIRYTLMIIIIGVCLFPLHAAAEAEREDFDFFLFLTQQDLAMDWWFAVPSRFGPSPSRVDKVTKGEYFKVLPIFKNYGVTSGGGVDITYDVEIIKPDGNTYKTKKNLLGFRDPAPGSFLLPSVMIAVISFEPEDPYGEYTINVSAYDHVKGKKAEKIEKITLEAFNIKELEGNWKEWYLTYPTCPRPVLALSAFINPPRPYLDNEDHPWWSALWFYKCVYAENEFLIPHTIEFYKTKATTQQRKDIILLFYLLNEIESLPIEDDLIQYLADLKKIGIPDPYKGIVSPDQLDMLFAEFFATSRIKPVQQLLTALNLHIYSGTLDKMESGELDGSSTAVREKACLELLFKTALWSIARNCRQSLLFFQYCMGLCESDQLNEIERDWLIVILKSVSEEKLRKIQPDTTTK